MQASTIKEILANPDKHQQVTISGWVRSRRDSKSGFSFINMYDGSNLPGIQVVASNVLDNYEHDILQLTKDCAITVNGELVESKGGSQSHEIVATKVTVSGFVESANTYPVSLKKHTMEHLRGVLHLRSRTNVIASVSRIRNTISYGVHKYLQDNGFYWIHTPVLTSIDAEGAGELFRVTSLDLQNIPKDKSGHVDYSEDFFAREAFLTVSGQLNAECYCLSMSRVYTFGPTFRAENSNTTRHLAEFWMVEPEIAFADLMDDALLAQNLIKSLVAEVLNKNLEDLEFLSRHLEDETIITRLQDIVNKDFAMVTYTEAIKYLENAAAQVKFENPVFWGVDLSSEHERYLCEQIIKAPVIVTNYPKDIKAFYMRQNDDGKTVAAMDILAPGIGEIVGGSAREERYDLLYQRIVSLNMSVEKLSWYLDLRKFGSSPHAGFGLGLDRFVSYVTGMSNIKDVIAFPRSSKSISY